MKSEYELWQDELAGRKTRAWAWRAILGASTAFWACVIAWAVSKGALG